MVGVGKSENPELVRIGGCRFGEKGNASDLGEVEAFRGLLVGYIGLGLM